VLARVEDGGDAALFAELDRMGWATAGTSVLQGIRLVRIER
jgi:hypothetical protein